MNEHDDDFNSESKCDMEPTAHEAGIALGGYSQTYVILKGSEKCNSSDESKESKSDGSDQNEVFFRCGNWCYKGVIQRSGLNLDISDLPVLIPTLQRQQGSLRYFCNANSVPAESVFSDPLEFVNAANMYIAGEISSDHVDKILRKWGSMYPWIDDDTVSTFFELMVERPEFMDKVAIIASKIYYQGLILISIYHEKSIYFIVQPGEGDQPLLDVKFPDVSRHGQGVQIASYHHSSIPFWKRLTLWHIIEGEKIVIPREIPKIRTLSVSSKDYVQTYCIMKNTVDDPAMAAHHDVLFRFGSWCYSGRVQLIPTLSLADIPFVIPALRMQQSRLDFLCEVSKVPLNSHFAPILQYMQEIAPVIENLIVGSETAMRTLIDKLNMIGMGDSISQWLEGDPENSFFELQIAPDFVYNKVFNNVELVASKSYHASGVVTMTIIFQGTVYVCLSETSAENPLLDSKFPDVAAKGRGFQVQAYDSGIEGLRPLRKISIWQTLGSMEENVMKKISDEAVKDSDDVERHIEGMSISGEAKGEAGDIAEAKDCTSSNTAGRHVGSGANSTPSYGSHTAMDHGQAEAKWSGTSNEKSNKAVDEDGCSSPSRPPSSSATLLSASPNPLPSSPNAMPSMAAKPHHLPKMESLSKKMDELRRKMEMGEDIEPSSVKKKKGKKKKANEAPWDTSGRPVPLEEDATEDISMRK